MKTHYNPFAANYPPDDNECCETGYCGTYLNEYVFNCTGEKKEVTCKKCISLFEKADAEYPWLANQRTSSTQE